MTNKHAWWMWALQNSIYVICWTILAVVFHKWWIALFAALFVSSLETKSLHRYFRICDKCGKRSPDADDYNGAIDKAKAAGWVVRKTPDGWDDRCPDCQ